MPSARFLSLFAGPYSGKTSFLRHIIQTPVLRNTPTVIVFISCKSLEESNEVLSATCVLPKNASRRLESVAIGDIMEEDREQKEEQRPINKEESTLSWASSEGKIHEPALKKRKMFDGRGAFMKRLLQHKFSEKASPARILRLILGQLVHQTQNGIKKLETAINRATSHPSTLRKQLISLIDDISDEDLSLMWNLLRLLLQQLESDEIVVAIDELESVSHNSRLEFVRQLRQVWESTAERSIKMRVVLASRPDKDLSEVLDGLPVIDEQSELNGAFLLPHFYNVQQ
jgi:hypothetical protein